VRITEFKGKGKNLQLEHALFVTSEFGIKETIFDMGWTRGKYDQ
jgi:hypothetical protein